MSERHELDVEIVFSREGQQRFRASAADLSIALEFVEQHAEIRFVDCSS